MNSLSYEIYHLGATNDNFEFVEEDTFGLTTWHIEDLKNVLEEEEIEPTEENLRKLIRKIAESNKEYLIQYIIEEFFSELAFDLNLELEKESKI